MASKPTATSSNSSSSSPANPSPSGVTPRGVGYQTADQAQLPSSSSLPAVSVSSSSSRASPSPSGVTPRGVGTPVSCREQLPSSSSLPAVREAANLVPRKELTDADLPEALRAVLPYGGKVELGEIRRRMESIDERWSLMFATTRQRSGEKGLLQYFQWLRRNEILADVEFRLQHEEPQGWFVMRNLRDKIQDYLAKCLPPSPLPLSEAPSTSAAPEVLATLSPALSLSQSPQPEVPVPPGVTPRRAGHSHESTSSKASSLPPSSSATPQVPVPPGVTPRRAGHSPESTLSEASSSLPSSSATPQVPVPPGVTPRRAGHSPESTLSEASSLLPSSSATPQVPVPPGVTPRRAGHLLESTSSTQEAVSLSKAPSSARMVMPQVPALENFTRTAPRMLGFAKNSCIKIIGAHFVEDINARPPAVKPLDLTNKSEYYRYGQGRHVDHWSLPFRPPIEVHTESWREIENRVPKDLLQEADPGRDWKDIDELLFRFGRVPAAWKFGPHGNHRDLGSRRSTLADIEALTKGLHFDDLNRAAFPGRLHRLSRTMSGGKASQINLRIGRVVSGPGWVFADLLKENRSIVFAAPPARGKTTLLRDICRLLHDLGYQRKLVLIDRSDELGGSSDDPHACLGKDVQVKRMEGRKPDEIIREAIRNLSPDVLIIDEIGSKVEAEALRAAKQAGVTVIATCHGDLPQFVRNRALSDLAGRITVSILGDTMAGSAGAAFRKVKEEREEPPVFDTLVEVEAINQWAIYHHLESVIDTLLAKGEKLVEIRRITADGTLVTWLENRNLDQSSGVMARTGAAAAEGQERDMNNLWILEQAAIARKHYEEEAKEEARKREEKAREEERMRKGKAPMRK
ncbi:Uncharacterized protein HDU90_006747 [Geranomyces variabilis]|nr:Uncharacterized protein HDU90_006747 [Geranomyces variabilis]